MPAVVARSKALRPPSPDAGELVAENNAADDLTVRSKKGTDSPGVNGHRSSQSPPSLAPRGVPYRLGVLHRVLAFTLRRLKPQSRHATRRRPARTPYDKLIFVLFCASLVVFLHALSGSGDKNLTQHHEKPRKEGWRGRLERTGRQTHFSVDHDGYYSSALPLNLVGRTARGAIDTNTLPIPAPTQSSHVDGYDRRHIPSPDYPFPSNPREALLNSGDYEDNDGKPFALKIHIDDNVPEVYAIPQRERGRGRCRNLEGARCNVE